MQEGLTTALLWVAFGGTHIGLATAPIRKRLVRALGEPGYVVLYSAVALGTFAALTRYVALHRFADARVPLMASIPPVRGALLVVCVFGFSLFIAAVFGYPRAPMAVFRHRVVQVRGIQQITRHPFFSGIALWAAAHALMAPSSVSFVYFVGLVALCLLGAIHQDQRLIAELGEPYRGYVAATSFWPFVAVATKRQKIDWLEQPWIGYAVGVIASLGLYEVHDHIFDRDGLYVIAVVSLGSIMAILNSGMRRAKAGEAPDV